MANQHSIEHHKIKLRTSGGTNVADLNRQLHAQRNQLFEIIAELFDEYFPEDKLIEIDSIHLDLGRFSPQGFFPVLKDRLKALLRVELEKIAKNGELHQYLVEAPDVLQDDFARLAFYLKFGYLPAYANQHTFSLKEVFETLNEKDQQRLATTFQQGWQHSNFKVRSLKQLTSTQLAMVEKWADEEIPGQGSDRPTKEEEKLSILYDFFLNGEISDRHLLESPLQLEEWLDSLSIASSYELLQKTLQILHSADTKRRIAQSLSLASIYQWFESSKHRIGSSFSQAIDEIEHFKSLLQSLKGFKTTVESINFKLHYLTYIQYHQKNENEQAQHLLHFLIKHGVLTLYRPPKGLSYQHSSHSDELTHGVQMNELIKHILAVTDSGKKSKTVHTSLNVFDRLIELIESYSKSKLDHVATDQYLSTSKVSYEEIPPESEIDQHVSFEKESKDDDQKEPGSTIEDLIGRDDVLRDSSKIDHQSEEVTKQDVEIDSNERESLMGVLFRFLTLGWLASGQNLDEIVERILSKHAVLFKQTVLRRWNEFPIRYRLAYQLKRQQQDQIVDILFSGKPYLQWFQAVLSAIELKKDTYLDQLPKHWSSHLYFTFFEMQNAEDAQLIEQVEFTDRLLLQWRNLLRSSGETSEKELDEVEGIDELVLSVLKKSESLEAPENQDYDYWSDFEMLILQGETAEEYKAKFEGETIVRRLLDQVLLKPVLARTLFLKSKAHKSFWSNIVQQFHDEQLLKLLKTLIPAYKQGLGLYLKELMWFETEVLHQNNVIYPLTKAQIIAMIRAVTEIQGALNEANFMRLVFAVVFSPSTRNYSLVKHERLVWDVEDLSFGKQLYWLQRHSLSDSIRARFPHLLSFFKTYIRWGQEDTAPAVPNWKEKGIVTKYLEKYDNHDLIRHYLEHGRFPVWAIIKQPNELLGLFWEGWLVDPKYSIEQLKFVTSNEQFTIRLIKWVGEQNVFQLAATNSAYKSFELQQIYDDLKPLPLYLDTPVKKLQDFSLQLLVKLMQVALENEQARQSLAEFINDLIQKLSDQYGLDSANIFRVLASFDFELSSPSLIKEIERLSVLEIVQQDENWIENAIVESQRKQYASPDLVVHYLKKATIPTWSTIANPHSFSLLIEEILERTPKAMEQVLIEISDDEKALKRLFKLVDKAILWKILELKHSHLFPGLQLLIDDFQLLFSATALISDGLQSFEEVLHKALSSILSKVTSGRSQLQVIITHLISVVSLEYDLPSALILKSFEELSSTIKSTVLKSVIRKRKKIEESDDWMTWQQKGVKKAFVQDFDTSSVIRHYLLTEEFPKWSLVKSKKKLADLIGHGLVISKIHLEELIDDITKETGAIERLVSLLGPQGLWDLMRIKSQKRTNLYKAIFSDLMIIQQSDQLVPVSIKAFEKQLFLIIYNEFIVPENNYKTDVTLISNLFEQLSKTFAKPTQVVYETINRHLGDLKSKALKNFIKSAYRDIADTTIDSLAANLEERSPVSEIDLLLHLMRHKSFPWWLKQSGANKIHDPDLHLKELIDKITHKQLAALLAEIAHTSEPSYYLKEIISNTSIEDYYRIITELAPGTSGFVITYLMSLQQWLSTQSKTLSYEFYWLVLQETINAKSSFSAQAFVLKALQLTSKQILQTPTKVFNALSRVVEERVDRGENRYKPLREILGSIDRPQLELILANTFLKEKGETDLSTPESSALDREEVNTASQSTPESTNQEGLKSSTYSFKDRLFYYLTNNSLKPEMSLVDQDYDTFIEELKHNIQQDATTLRIIILNALAPRGRLENVLKLNDDQFKAQLVHVLSPVQWENLLSFRTEIVGFITSSFKKVAKVDIVFISWYLLIKALVEKGSSKLDDQTYVELVLNQLSQKHIYNIWPELSAKVAQYVKRKSVPTPFVDVLNQLVEISKDKKRREEVLDKEMNATQTDDKEPTKLEGAVNVRNAGLVILASFLPRYFEILEMLDEEQFKDEKQAARAVLLIQYLANGETETPEHELLLNKVLCGVDLAEPLELSLSLTDREKDISISLLNGVLQNWGKLSDSSVEALREGFLIREGRLWETEGAFKLKVEKKTLDILMDYMPWSFGLIKLSWMNKPLEVDWL